MIIKMILSGSRTKEPVCTHARACVCLCVIGESTMNDIIANCVREEDAAEEGESAVRYCLTVLVARTLERLQRLHD